MDPEGQAMEDGSGTEKTEETQEAQETGVLELDGEAWKDRGRTTYTSLLDRYGVTDLFSTNSIQQYQRQRQTEHEQQSELTEYIFSGRMHTRSEEEDLTDLIFSQEIQLSKVKDYSRSEEDYSICFAMAEFLFVLVFIYVLMKINAARRKKRDKDAVEVDMEDRGQAGYGSAGV